MSTIQLLAVLVAPLLFAAAFAEASKPAEPKAPPRPAVVKFLGQPTIDVLNKGDKVEVFRVSAKRSDDKGGKVKTVGGYVVSAEGKPQDKAFAGRIADVLLDEKTYDFDTAKLCDFDPGVGYRIWAGDTFVELVLCFTCNEVAVFAPKAAVDGSVRSAMEDFDNSRPALVKLAKDAFPDDKEIQAMKEEE